MDLSVPENRSEGHREIAADVKLDQCFQDLELGEGHQCVQDFSADDVENLEQEGTSHHTDATNTSISTNGSIQRPSKPQADFESQDKVWLPSKLSSVKADEVIPASHVESSVDVTQSQAPAVTHETVRKTIHHIREEIITREIHEHDIFHRILPVVDVEVLPTRHFLPVQGGGLVQVSADQVPGRGQTFTIVETVSRARPPHSSQAKRRNFTARRFQGTEGDFGRHESPEGFERTEQTWVHPPVLETGAEQTGQSWPMIFQHQEEPAVSASD